MELDECTRKERNETRTLMEMENRTNELTSLNRMIKFDIDRLRDEYSIVDKNNIENIRTHEDRIRNNEILIEEMEKKHRSNAEHILYENNYRVKELVRDWENRCRGLEERSRNLELENGDLETELKRIGERSVDMKIRQEEELRELAHRVEDEEY